MLKISHVTKTFYQKNSEITVVDGLSLEIKRGEVFGFLGPNGAGKTTTVKMITGLLFADKGKITINKLPSDSYEAKKILGFMPENPQFYRYLKAIETVELMGGLFGIDKKILKDKALKLLDRVGLADAKNQYTKQFSKGMTQRLAFACALINDPDLLILDEPLDGLDPIGRLDFKELLLELKKQGKTVFLNTHILADVEEICDQVAIINHGKILSQGRPRDLIGNKYKTLEEMFVATIRKDTK